MNIQISKAKVKYESGKVLNTAHGPRINCVVTLESGEEKTLWGNPKDEIANLRKGDSIEIIKTANGGMQLLSKAQEMTPSPTSSELPAVAKLGDLLSECYSAMVARQPNLCEDTTKALAISLFIQVSKNC